jgi:hypothetical protein
MAPAQVVVKVVKVAIGVQVVVVDYHRAMLGAKQVGLDLSVLSTLGGNNG